MAAYYNEIDPFAAQWLRELIKLGHIADGEVDERSIVDVKPNEIRGFTQCHFFAGIGVWSYALRQAGWTDDRPVWTGSCPCQPFSSAGKGIGFDDERHLWPHFQWLIEQVKPNIVIGEQVASKDGLEWIDLVQSDLEGSGYTSGAIDTSAAGFGAPHIRQRLYWAGIRLADSNNERLSGPVQLINFHGQEGWEDKERRNIKSTMAAPIWNGECNEGSDGILRYSPALTIPLGDGPSSRVGRLRGYGNAIVAPQAQAFIESVMEVLDGYNGPHTNSVGNR